MPSVEPCALPNLPPGALHWIKTLDPEVEIVLLRKGSKSYEEFDAFAASPSPEMVMKDVARRVADNVESDGNGYFGIQIGEDAKTQFRWYAFRAELDVSKVAPDLDPLTRHALTLLEYTSNSLIRFVGVLPTMAQSMVDTSKAASDSQADVINQLRESASENAEVLIAGMAEDRKLEREKVAFQLIQQHLDKSPKADSTTAGLLQHLMVRVEPDDLDVLRKDSDGAELLNARTPMGFRDAAVRLAKRFFAGEVKLSKTATQRLTEWLPTIIELGQKKAVEAGKADES